MVGAFAAGVVVSGFACACWLAHRLYDWSQPRVSCRTCGGGLVTGHAETCPIGKLKL